MGCRRGVSGYPDTTKPDCSLAFVSCCDTLPAARGGGRVTNKLFYGDNLDVLREHIASESLI